MTMVKISDCFHYIIILMLCNEIGWHDLQIRQVSGKFADCAVQFANWPDRRIGRNRYIRPNTHNVTFTFESSFTGPSDLL